MELLDIIGRSDGHDRANDGDTRSAFNFAIVGGGFTGVALAAQLLRNSGGTVSVALVERGARPGRGVAYGTECGDHLLNVRASNMSAYPDDPGHFLRWAQANHDLRVQPDDYLPRQVYGRYVASLLQRETERHPGRFEHLEDEAVSIARFSNKAEVRLLSGRTLLASKVVLALGNFPPSDLRLSGMTAESRRYVSDPWATGALTDVAQYKTILLIGSGLTSVDVAIALWKQGFRGNIHALSRRGLLPQSHKATTPWPAFWDEKSPRTARGLLRLIWTQVKAAEAQGSGWRAVIDSLRPFTQEIWRSLPRQEQRRFLRHGRPYWEVHRHRVAPEIGRLLAAQMQDGQMEIHAGRVNQYCEDRDGVDVTYRDRKAGKLVSVRVDRVINCTGPEVDCRRIGNPLLTDLLRQKLVRPDPLFLGLDTSAYGALMNALGEPSDFLYAAGPSRKGSLWESTAVPEIRAQVAELATLLLTTLRLDGGVPVDSSVLEAQPAPA
jgi:uncharacterized NAD(P)/FAD-binding protein YdhS